MGVKALTAYPQAGAKIACSGYVKGLMRYMPCRPAFWMTL